MAQFGSLNNDIWSSVLSRLAVKDLIRLRCVCKGWYQLISDPVFRRVHLRKGKPISGFFFTVEFVQNYNLSAEVAETMAYLPLKLGSGLYQPDFNFLPEDIKVLASCNGLIFCRSSIVSRDSAFYICNPLNKEWIRLNLNEPDIMDDIGLAFDPCQNFTDSLTNFKLVSVQKFETGSEGPYFQFNVYSYDAGFMKTIQKILHHGGHVYKKEIIFVNGMLHWLTISGEILAFNVVDGESSIVSVPFEDVPADGERLHACCIGESHDKLQYVMIFNNGLDIWSLEDYAESKWNLQYSRSVNAIMEENQSLHNRSEYMWPMIPLVFKDKYLLLEATSIYLYNIETRKMDEVFPLSQLPEHTTSSCSSAHSYCMSLMPLNSAQGLLL
ncbi:F-box protein [Melia azedarach]|uniref:F-box protein n=1 Tax=Melia azedarach TaxID=155640 RepID=A0ACC1XQ94_MELAZ|nr:F-box protein [Melia azedarach]